MLLNAVMLAELAPVPPPATGNPVQFVKTPEVGVPKSGVTRVGEVALTGAPAPVAVVQTGNALAPPPISTSVVAPAARLCCAPVAVVPVATRAYAVVPVALPVPPPVTNKPVQLVSVPDVGVPKRGVTKVGEVALTGDPVPVEAVNTGITPAPPPIRIWVVAALKAVSATAQFAASFTNPSYPLSPPSVVSITLNIVGILRS
jgi:hypothetical protein